MDISVLWVLKDSEMAERGSRVGRLYHPRSVRVGLVPPACLVHTILLLYPALKLEVFG